MKNNSRLIELQIKKESENLTLHERKEFQELLRGNDSYSQLVDFLDSIEEKDVFVANEEIDLVNNFQKLEKKINANNSRINIKKYLLLAASFLIAFIFIKYIFFPIDKNKLAENIFTTEKGSKSTLNLPDGSKIWINSDTKVTYNDDFGKNKREIFLEGEAYFDIVKDVERPFVVHTSNMKIKVLGTIFNVRAYPDEDNTETSLIEGSIEVALPEDGSKIFQLKANEKIIVNNDSKQKNNGVNESSIIITKVKKLETDSSIVETLWRENKLAFREENLKNIVKLLNHWYNIDIIITDEKLTNNLYSGTFKEDNIRDVMDALSLTGDFTYNKKNDTIFIIPK